MFSTISIIVAIVLFFIQIPIKSAILALKVSLTTGKIAGKAVLTTGKLAGKVALASSKLAGKTALKAGTELTGTTEQADDLKARLQNTGNKVKKVTNVGVNTAKVTGKAVKTTGKAVKGTVKATKVAGKVAIKGTKTAVKTTKNTVKLAQKATQLAIKAIQLTIKVLEFILGLIKALISFLLSLGVVGIVILVIIILIFLVAIIAAVVCVNNEVRSNSSAYVSSGGSNGGGSGSNTEVIVDVDTSSLESCCQSMANWYIANVTTYQQNTSGSGSGTRKAYTCSILNNGQTVYDDCTGFSAAYASLVSGKKVEAYGSEQLYKGGQSYIDAGWTRYTIADIGGVSGLVVGDILVCNSSADSNCKGHHAEIYLGTGKSFGWGKIQSSYPSSSATLIDSSINGYIEDGGSHRYGVIYRYTGGS